MKLRTAFASFAPFLLALPLSLGQACYYDDDDDDDDDCCNDFVVVSSGFEIEPNDESASPHFLGVLRHGEAMIVEGHAIAGDVTDPLADPFDGFAISLTQPTEIEFALYFDDLPGELDVWIYDPAIDDIALFFETDSSPELGVFFVEEPVLDFQIVVFAFVGESDYRLEVYARPIWYGSTGAPAETWRGSVTLAPGFPALERNGFAALRRRAEDAYLRRPLADLVPDEAIVRIGTILALDEEPVFELPVYGDPSGVPFTVLRE